MYSVADDLPWPCGAVVINEIVPITSVLRLIVCQQCVKYLLSFCGVQSKRLVRHLTVGDSRIVFEVCGVLKRKHIVCLASGELEVEVFRVEVKDAVVKRPVYRYDVSVGIGKRRILDSQSGVPVVEIKRNTRSTREKGYLSFVAQVLGCDGNVTEKEAESDYYVFFQVCHRVMCC